MKTTRPTTQLLCPVDGKPCERDCPDRYRDRPEGGCFLTTFLEFPNTRLLAVSGEDAILVMGGEHLAR